MQKSYLPFYYPNFIARIRVATVRLYRKWKYGYEFRLIELSRGKYAKVDPEDFEALNQFKWYTSGTKSFYASRPARNASGKRTSISMHRQLMNHPAGYFVDHENGDSLDNRKANLRLATPAENSRNRRKHCKSSSKYKGVAKNSKCKTYFASIGYENKQIYLGSFASEEEAARAYDKAAKKLFGEFASLNFEDDSHEDTKARFFLITDYAD